MSRTIFCRAGEALSLATSCRGVYWRRRGDDKVQRERRHLRLRDWEGIVGRLCGGSVDMKAIIRAGE